MSDTQQGPMIETTTSPHARDLTRFNSLLNIMQDWRNADHDDWLSLSRNQVIDLIEGIEALRRS